MLTMRRIVLALVLFILPISLYGQTNVSGGSTTGPNGPAAGCTSDGVNPTRCPNGINTALNGDYEEYTVDTGGVTAGLALCATSNVDAGGRPKVLPCSHVAANPGAGFVGIAKATVAAAGTVVVCWTVNCSATFDNGSTALNEAVFSVTTDGQLHDTSAQTATAGQPNFSVLNANAGAGTNSLISLTGMLAQNPKGGGGNGKNGVTSITGDGSGYSNSSSTGAVTLTKASQNPNLVAAGPISSSVSNLVQSNSAVATGGSNATVSYNTTPTTNDLLIAVTVNNVGHVNTLTGGGNTWIHGVTGTTGSLVTDIWYTCSAAGSATTVTPTFPGGTVITLVQVYEYSGNATANCLDTTGVAGANTPGVSVMSVTTGGSVAQSTELVFGSCTVLFAGGTTLAVPPTYSTLIDTINGNSNQLTAQQNASTGLSGTQSLTCTAGVSNPAFLGALIATFKLNNSGSSPWTFRQIVNVDLPLHTPSVVYANTNTAQTSAISDTIMVTVASSQLYRFSGSVNCTTTTSTATATLNLKFTDTSSTAQTVSVTGTCTTLGSASWGQITQSIRAQAGTNITYGVTIANSPHFDVDVRLEQMN